VDVGLVNHHLFLNNVSLGNYPRMVRERTGLQRRGLPKRLAGAIAAFDTWWHLRSMTAALRLDDRDLVRRSPFIVIANGQYVLSGLDLGKREHISDGRLSLYVAPPSGRLGAMTFPLRALVGTLERHERFETLAASTITATLRSPRVAVAIDGEVRELQSPLEFTIRRQALRVLVPRE
jgi:diacylglycerol kinase family enzyme